MKKALVLKAPGTNNDYESWFSLKEAGADASIVHINELAGNRKKLKDFAILVIPGGFSYGDDLGAGKVFSIFLKYKLEKSVKDFIRDGRMVLGICNGFQVLVKSGLLPDMDSAEKVSLGLNSGGVFICRWVRLRINGKLFWFKGMDDEIDLPIAHAEGRFIAGSAVKSLEDKGQIALTYRDNPNGSDGDIAGIVNSQGNVLGLMPHPDRFISGFQHPASRTSGVKPWGRILFRNMVKNA
ncbi:MAG: phosphoribosylformylglycinamidine synthase I [Elusimicrobia bacterium]|nr:phosphoribosylformylglycinamidine synthase I [Elusimicrobiota bacterium]